MSPETENSSIRETLVENRRVVIFAAIAVVALIIACVLAVLLFLDRGGGQVVDSEVIPTPFPTVAATQPGQFALDPLVIGISGSDTISVSIDVPVTLTLGGQQFAVRTQVIEADGKWEPLVEGERTAAWIYGTVINYVVGLPDSLANQALLGQLAAGEEMVLTTRNGVDYTFAFSSRESVPSSSREVFGQNTPGLTLVLLGAAGEDRLVVRGHYVVPEARSRTQGPVIELGETAQLEDLQLTVTGASYVLDRPEAPAGFAFYMVDFQVQNVGLTALDLGNLRLYLMDGLGNQYATNPVASQLGNHPPLGGFLNSNQSQTATAGYQIPIGLNASALSWVALRQDTGGQVQVTIPFSGDGEAGLGTNVRLNQAEVSPDLTSLVLRGEVTNLGDQPLLVSEQDITLETPDGSSYLMVSSNPPFPWAVAAQQSLPYAVSFQWPLATDTAIFSVLNQPFQLSGLR
jgi:hypothetical protein